MDIMDMETFLAVKAFSLENFFSELFRYTIYGITVYI
jgi:hypothetical protein